MLDKLDDEYDNFDQDESVDDYVKEQISEFESKIIDWNLQTTESIIQPESIIQLESIIQPDSVKPLLDSFLAEEPVAGDSKV